jgi:5-methylthioadenosine/S-adenosylhomocysteine deaminase
MVRAGADLAEEFACPWHIHLAEATSETEYTQERYGLTPLRWLDSLGVLGPRSCLVHGVWLDEEEIEIVAEARARLIHCPSSNMFLGDGIAPIGRYLEKGIQVALGTDSGSASNRMSVFADMRQAVLLQRAAQLSQTALSLGDAFVMGTARGPGITGLPVGSLEPGKKADYVALDADAFSLLPPTDLLSNIVFAMEQEAILEVYVGGRAVVSNGKPTWAGAADLPARVNELVRRLDLPK